MLMHGIFMCAFFCDFDRRYFYFEVIECFRKLLLSAALIFITPGSATQGLFALLMAQGSQRLYVGCKQFPNPADNRLGELAQWQLVFIFLGELDGAHET